MSLFFTEVDHARPQYSLRRLDYLGIPCYEAVNNHVYRTFEETYANPAMDRLFTTVLDEVRPDVLHVHHLLHHSINYLHIARRRGLPVVFTLHDYWLSCPNLGQRMRADLEVCHEVDPGQCADCIGRFGGGRASFLLSRAASRFVGLWSSSGYSLLDRLPAARLSPAAGVRADRLAVAGDARDALVAPAPSRVGFDVHAPEGSRLQFGVAVGPEAGEGDEGVLLEVEADGRTIWSRALEGRPSARAWADAEVLLPSPANGHLRLDLVTRPANGGPSGGAGWSGLRVRVPDGVQARVAPVKGVYRAALRLLSPDGHDARRARVEERLRHVREAVAHVDLFVAPSPFLAREMRAFGLPAARLEESDYGLPTERFAAFARRPERWLRFGYVGTLAPHKGVHLLIEAFRRLRPAGGRPAPVLRVHGNLTWFPAYCARLRRLAEGAAVEFLGEFDNRRAAEVYAGFDVLVVPSLWWENAPLTIHEASLTGTPVVAADFGGMADFVTPGRNGLLFRRADASDLARQMQAFVDDPALLSRLGQPVFPVKGIEEDAANLERRYAALLGARSESRAAAL